MATWFRSLRNMWNEEKRLMQDNTDSPQTCMCRCQKKTNECFHVCMQLVLNPCTQDKFRKWWLLICTARNSLVVLTCNVLESLSKICTHFAQTMQHSYLSVLRAEKGFCLRLLEFHAREHNPSFDLYGPYYMAYVLSEIYISINWIWSDPV